jgi:hypothetical protein
MCVCVGRSGTSAAVPSHPAGNLVAAGPGPSLLGSASQVHDTSPNNEVSLLRISTGGGILSRWSSCSRTRSVSAGQPVNVAARRDPVCVVTDSSTAPTGSAETGTGVLDSTFGSGRHGGAHAVVSARSDKPEATTGAAGKSCLKKRPRDPPLVTVVGTVFATIGAPIVHPASALVRGFDEIAVMKKETRSRYVCFFRWEGIMQSRSKPRRRASVGNSSQHQGWKRFQDKVHARQAELLKARLNYVGGQVRQRCLAGLFYLEAVRRRERCEFTRRHLASRVGSWV